MRCNPPVLRSAFATAALVAVACADSAEPVSGANGAIPADLVGVEFDILDEGEPALYLTIRDADDPACDDVGSGSSCFTILRRDRPTDRGARGPASFHDGRVQLRYELVPSSPREVGKVETYEVTGQELTLVGCDDAPAGLCFQRWQRAD